MQSRKPKTFAIPPKTFHRPSQKLQVKEISKPVSRPLTTSKPVSRPTVTSKPQVKSSGCSSCKARQKK